MNKIIEWHKDFKNKKQLVAFYLLVGFGLICLIFGIVLTSVGSYDYSLFVNQWKIALASNTTVDNPIDIAMFIYGIFFIVLTIILLIGCLLYGNSIFNRKYQNKTNQ